MGGERESQPARQTEREGEGGSLEKLCWRRRTGVDGGGRLLVVTRMNGVTKVAEGAEGFRLSMAFSKKQTTATGGCEQGGWVGYGSWFGGGRVDEDGGSDIAAHYEDVRPSSLE